MNNRSQDGKKTTPPEPDFDNIYKELVALNTESLNDSQIELLKYLTECFAKHPVLPTPLAPNYNSVSSHKHARIAYDPETLTTYDTVTKLSKKYKSSPIGFIQANTLIPGTTNPPAAARAHLFQDEEIREQTINDHKGQAYVVCCGHGGLVNLGSLQTDHVTSASDILIKQIELVKLLNENKETAMIFIEDLSLHDFFVDTPTGYQGTLYFYERYYNDIENLWNICSHCNLKKSNIDSYNWFQKNPSFGDKFIKSLALKDKTPTGFINNLDGVGLARVALKWYKENQADTINATLELHKNVVFKIEANLEKAREAVADGNLAKAYEYNAKAKFDTQVASLVVGTKFNIKSKELSPGSSPGSSQGLGNDDQDFTTEDLELIAEELQTSPSTRAISRKEYRKIVLNVYNKVMANDSNKLSSLTRQEQIEYHQNQIELLEEKINYHKSEIEVIKANPTSSHCLAATPSSIQVESTETGISDLKRRSFFSSNEGNLSTTTFKKQKVESPTRSETASEKIDMDDKPDIDESIKPPKH